VLDVDFQWITGSVGYFQGAVNIGYIKVSSQEGLLVDAGLDEQAMKKVLRHLGEQELPLTHLFITHAHADHYGGAAYLQEKQEIHTYAPLLESAILENPILEPLYLFHGVYPLPHWRNKFLEGKPVRVDTILMEEENLKVGEVCFKTIALPGHSYNQFGIIAEDILFAADGYFGKESLNKHGIPYIVDAARTVESLEKIKRLPCKGAIPGHGSYEEDYIKTIEENIRVHNEIEQLVEENVSASKSGITLENLVAVCCSKKAVVIKNAPSYMLFRTAVSAYLTKLISEQKVDFAVKNNQLVVESLSR
jgi:glyoxylase-like metal-dependent hydrolase (beta-lactamase superfamily II)